MKPSALSLLTLLFVALTSLAKPAAADTLQFSFAENDGQGALTFNFTLPSNPTPASFSTGSSFTTQPVTVTGDLSSGTPYSTTSAITFVAQSSGGGFNINIPGYSFFDLLSVPLYTGPESAPTLNAGDFSGVEFVARVGDQVSFLGGSLDITDLTTSTPTPEPSSLVLLATGALGLVSAARRKYRA